MIYEFDYASHPDSLEEMHLDLDLIAARHLLPDEVFQPFRVAVSEAITNAIIHAHDSDSSKIIRFTVDLNDERITASVVDEGVVRDDEALANFDPAGSPDAEGGRGLGLIKRLSDEVSFTKLPQGGMAVKIIKNLI